MRAAILGSGFSGLAAAWHLLQNGCEVTIYDPLGIGQGTSSIAAGMLHPFAGEHAKLNWRAREGMAATLALLKVAENALMKPVIVGKKLIRLAVKQQQVVDFAQCASLHNDVSWLSAAECQERVPAILPFPGILIESALAIDCSNYLQGLWLACQKRGALFEQKSVQTLSELSEDLIIVAMGAATTSLPELSHLKLKPIKGQILKMEWPKNIERPQTLVSSQTYLVAWNGANNCIIGATFEKQFSSPEVDLNLAKKEILTKTAAYLPAIANAKILNCQAGMRATTPDKRPLMAQINERCWVLTGMGAKGLLYHALLAEELAIACLKTSGAGSQKNNKKFLA